MKNTASKVSAIIFTIIATAAFAWMTMRPKVDIQATGFALASSGSTNTATKALAETAVPSSDNTDKEPATDRKENNEENIDNADEKDTNNSTTKDLNSLSEGNFTKDSKANKDNSKLQEQAPAEPKAPTAPTAPESPVAPITSNNEDNQIADKKKFANEENSSTEKTQTDSIKATTPANKTKESSNTATTTTTTTAVTTIAIATQDKQQKSAIYTQADNARGTLIIMHDCDYKPDVKGGIVTTLHKNLPRKGWNTLSFQLPNLSTDSTFKDLEAVMPEVAKSIESSIAMAKEKSDTPIALLGHGCGSQMALAWMEVKGSDSIDAYIGLGTGIMNSDAKDTDHLRIPLEAMQFPQLDIFGSADNEAVLKTAPERLGHINRAANSASRQKMLLDADHNMTGKEEQLSRIIAKWLNKKAFK
jgi:hypothetical protein